MFSSFIIIAAVMIFTLVAFSIHVGIIQATYYANYNNQAVVTGQMQSEPNLGFTPLYVLFNPAVPVGNFVLKAYFGYSIADVGAEAKNILPGSMYFLTQHWNVFGVITNLLVALFFVWRAARNINPLKKVKHKTKMEDKAKKTDSEEEIK